MTKKFAPIAVLFGLLSALLFGSVGVAQAGTLNYECIQKVGVNVVSCNEASVDVDITIEGNRVLTDNEINVLTNNLNNTKVEVEALETVIINTYKSFNPSINITVGNITVCIVAVCQ